MNINKILAAHSVPTRFGAPMGAQNVPPETGKLYVQRLHLVDYCYDESGVYWGSPSATGRMFCGFNTNGARIYVRALSRADALAKIRTVYPFVSFYRS